MGGPNDRYDDKQTARDARDRALADELAYEKEARARKIIQDFNGRYGYFDQDILFIAQLRAAGLNDEQIATVINAMDETCAVCRNSYYPCHCSNDE